MRRKAELWNGRGLLPRRNGEDVCQPIRDAILETGMTNRQIAAACGVTQTQVSEAIHRTDEIRFLALKRICNFLCLDVEEVCPNRREVRRDRIAARTYGSLCKRVRDTANRTTIDANERAALIRRLLKCLTARQREVLMMRFGLYNGYAMTLEEVARIYNVYRERVRSTEAKALRTIRKHLRRNCDVPARMLNYEPQPLTEFGEMLKGLAA